MGGDGESIQGTTARGGWPRRVAVSGILAGVALPVLPLPPQLAVATVGGSAALLLVATHAARPVAGGRAAAFYRLGGAFLIASLVSLLGSRDPWRGASVSLFLLPQVLLFHAIASRFSPAEARRLALALVVASAVLSLGVLLAALRGAAHSTNALMAAAGLPFFPVPNDLLFTVLVAPFALAMLMAGDGPAVRLVGGVALLLSGAALVVDESRTGVALCLLLAVLAVLRWRPGRRMLLLVLVGAPLAVLLFDAATGFALLRKFARLDSLSTRIPLWIAAWKMFLAAPWFGHGPGMFSLLYETYLADVRLPGWVLFEPDVHAPWPHSLYLELLAERGLAGFVCVAAGVHLAGRLLWRVPPGARQLGAAAGASAVLVLLGGLTEFSLLRYWFVQFSLVMLAMLLVVNDGWEMRHE